MFYPLVFHLYSLQEDGCRNPASTFKQKKLLCRKVFFFFRVASINVACLCDENLSKQRDEKKKKKGEGEGVRFVDFGIFFLTFFSTEIW